MSRHSSYVKLKQKKKTQKLFGGFKVNSLIQSCDAVFYAASVVASVCILAELLVNECVKSRNVEGGMTSSVTACMKTFLKKNFLKIGHLVKK